MSKKDYVKGMNLLLIMLGFSENWDAKRLSKDLVKRLVNIQFLGLNYEFFGNSYPKF